MTSTFARKLMELQHFVQRARSRFPDCEVQTGATQAEMEATEHRFGVRLPYQVRQFYQCCNGISFTKPFLKVLPLDQLSFSTNDKRLVFCYIDTNEPIAFETVELNEANQWSIFGCTQNHRITYTMASFWSSKVWGWLEHNRPIWSSEEYQKSEQIVPPKSDRAGG